MHKSVKLHRHPLSQSQREMDVFAHFPFFIVSDTILKAVLSTTESGMLLRTAHDEHLTTLTTLFSASVRTSPTHCPSCLLSGTLMRLILQSSHSASMHFLYLSSSHDSATITNAAFLLSTALHTSRSPRAKQSLARASFSTCASAIAKSIFCSLSTALHTSRS